MAITDRDIAILTVLVAVGFLGILTWVTYRCNPSLFKRRHRARPGLASSWPAVRQVPKSDGIDEAKLSKVISNASLRSSRISTTSTQKSTKSSVLASVAEVPADMV